MHITAKLGNMRKAVEWVIYPESNAEHIKIQSDNRIAIIYIKTGKAVLSKHCQNGAYFPHLSKDLGATEIIVAPELINELINNQPKSGDVLISAGAFKIIAA